VTGVGAQISLRRNDDFFERHGLSPRVGNDACLVPIIDLAGQKLFSYFFDCIGDTFGILGRL
jgi:hypothetical protein